jgi:hypothetical protein
MKISEATIEVLRNFASIQPNLVVSAGSNLKTISEARNIMVSADIDETFDKDFGIYDLNEFLSAFNLIDGAELEFTDNAVLIKGADDKVVYRFANAEILAQPAKTINMPEADLEMTLTESEIAQVKRAASALGHPVLSITKEDNDTVVKVCDPNNPTANTWSKKVTPAKVPSGSYDYQFLISNLKLIQDDYTLQVSNKLISSWKSNNRNPIVEYWIALEKTSTYED